MIGDQTRVGTPMRRRRGPIRVVIGLPMLIAGVIGIVIGIAGAVGARNDIEDDAVARAALVEPTSFKAVVGRRGGVSTRPRTGSTSSAAGRRPIPTW